MKIATEAWPNEETQTVARILESDDAWLAVAIDSMAGETVDKIIDAVAEFLAEEGPGMLEIGEPVDVDVAKVSWKDLAVHFVSRFIHKVQVIHELDALMERLPETLRERRVGVCVGIVSEPTEYGCRVYGEVAGQRVCILCAHPITSDWVRSAAVRLPKPDDVDSTAIQIDVCVGCQSFLQPPAAQA